TARSPHRTAIPRPLPLRSGSSSHSGESDRPGGPASAPTTPHPDAGPPPSPRRRGGRGRRPQPQTAEREPRRHHPDPRRRGLSRGGTQRHPHGFPQRPHRSARRQRLPAGVLPRDALQLHNARQHAAPPRPTVPLTTTTAPGAAAQEMLVTEEELAVRLGNQRRAAQIREERFDRRTPQPHAPVPAVHHERLRIHPTHVLRDRRPPRPHQVHQRGALPRPTPPEE